MKPTPEQVQMAREELNVVIPPVDVIGVRKTINSRQINAVRVLLAATVPSVVHVEGKEFAYEVFCAYCGALEKTVYNDQPAKRKAGPKGDR